jgi:dipicolinate synthase subunit A
MDKKINISIIGGDLRLVHLANLLSENYEVNVFGNNHEVLDSTIHKMKFLEKAIEKSSIIIFPIPFSKDSYHIYAPFFQEKIPYHAIEEKSLLDKTIVGGAFTKDFVLKLQEGGIQYRDIGEDEAFALYNAIPTAEGVIEIMMRESDITLYGSQCMILGFGKCGLVQAKILESLKPEITIAARNSTQLALAEINGYKCIHLDELEACINRFDFIINTIPAPRLNQDLLGKIKNTTIIIDIANQLEDQVIDNRIKVINARGIPGKYSPKSAAKIIYKTLIDKKIL